MVEGPNGSGKSTLLKLLTGLTSPPTGDIHWQGQSILHHPDYGQHLHYIGHLNGIKTGLTVLENLTFMHVLSGAALDTGILDLLKLKDHQQVLSRELSAGQKRRLALARLFCIKKPLWIVDEPLTAIDAETQDLFLSALKNHLAQNGMAVISTHQPILLNDVSIKQLRLPLC